MNTDVFYVTSIVFTGSSFFFLWQFGVKPLLLDNFRDSLFAIRDRLYALAQDGRIPCDSDAYRAVEALLNRTIRFAHRFTFLSFLLFALDSRELEGERSPHEVLIEKIAKISDPDVQKELTDIIRDTLTRLPRYIGKSSLMFILGSLIYFVFRSVSPLIKEMKQAAIDTFDVEARRDAVFMNAGKPSHS